MLSHAHVESDQMGYVLCICFCQYAGIVYFMMSVTYQSRNLMAEAGCSPH